MGEKEVGKITHYFPHVSAGVIALEDDLKVGDTIHIRGAHDDITQVIESMQVEHTAVSEGKKGDSIGIKVAHKVHPHDKVFKVIP
jgi:putative protease